MKSTINSILFSIAIIIASVVLGYAYVKSKEKERALSVTGLGKKDFSSDLIVWDGHFSREASDLKFASNELHKDRKIIQGYLKKNGVNDNEIVFNAIEISKLNESKYSSEGKYVGEVFKGYTLTQSVQITSKDIDKIEDISRKITELINEGIQFYSDPPRYYYTKLSDLKIELISAATIDARTRAEKISENSNGKIDELMSAQMGIFQITGQYSSEDFSWGGTFNTSSREKSATITMKLKYKIK